MAEWITSQEAADILGVGKSAIPKMLRRGDLTRRARKPILNRAEVLAYRDARLAAARAREESARSKGPFQPSPPDTDHVWLTSKEAGRLLGVVPIAVNARARRGRLPSVLANGRRWYRLDHLELFMRAQAVKRGQSRQRR